MAPKKSNKPKNGKKRQSQKRVPRNLAAPPRRVSKPNLRPGRLLASSINAHSERVLGLPRPVGPYTIIRATAVQASSSRFQIFAPFVQNDGVAPEKWMGMVGVRDVNAALAISAANNTNPILMTGLDSLTGTNLSTEVVPAAFTVRVMCGTALQTASGLVYIGRVPGNYSVGGSSLTWDQAAANLVSTSSPKIVQAGSLALDPQECHAVPYDFTEASDFRELVASTGVTSPFSWTGDGYRPGGFSPIYVYNPTSADLTFEITVQWRLRVDPANPFAGSHKYQPIGQISEWDRVMRMSAAAESAFHSFAHASNAVLMPLRRPLQAIEG